MIQFIMDLNHFGMLFISENLSMALTAMWVYSFMVSGSMLARSSRAILLVAALFLALKRFWKKGRSVTLPMNWKNR